MYILGIAGRNERGHDASACLLRDDKLITMVEEERLTRKKHSYDALPYNAIGFCLKEEGISVDDLDYVAIYWDYPYHYKIRNLEWKFKKNKIVDLLFPKKYFSYKKRPKIKFVNHHLSHASSAFRCSGFKKSLILVIDGQGEKYATTLWYGNKNKIKFLKGWEIKDSLGYFYETVSEHVGLEASEPGKLMALAAYGKPIYSKKFFTLSKGGYTSSIGTVKLRRMDEEMETREKWKSFIRNNIAKENSITLTFNKNLGKFVKPLINFDKKMKNLAASAQLAIEEVVLHIIKMGIDATGCRNLCLSGGVALNSLTNGKIVKSKLVKNIFIQPAANDAGCSLGAALEVYASLGHRAKLKLNHVYYGPEFSNDEILKIIRKYGLRYEYHKDISGVASGLISKNNVIGWFQGRMEFGPRALGNRSILANPSNPKMKDIINKKIKFREWFRPFAPTILDSKRDDYIENSIYSPFMLFVFDVKEEKKKEVPSILHIDGTTRPQTLKKNINPKYYKLIKNFENETSIPLVLNTSFNVKGEPIVCTPRDAIKMFYSSGLDYLIINDYLIKKR